MHQKPSGTSYRLRVNATTFHEANARMTAPYQSALSYLYNAKLDARQQMHCAIEQCSNDILEPGIQYLRTILNELGIHGVTVEPILGMSSGRFEPSLTFEVEEFLSANYLKYKLAYFGEAFSQKSVHVLETFGRKCVPENFEFEVTPYATCQVCLEVTLSPFFCVGAIHDMAHACNVDALSITLDGRLLVYTTNPLTGAQSLPAEIVLLFNNLKRAGLIAKHTVWHTALTELGYGELTYEIAKKFFGEKIGGNGGLNP